MAKKRVEEEKETAMDNLFNEDGGGMQGMQLDMNPQDINMSMQIHPNPVVPEAEVKQQPVTREKKELINCLRNERVIVRFVPKETAMVHNKNHILYGGMADTATRNFVVPGLSSTGVYENPLTNDEKAYLEYAMGLEENALSIYKRENNFWDDSNPNGIGRVTLHKQDNYLDLSNPADYIKYKILLANKDYIAPSQRELEERPKATYQFVILSEKDETASNLNKADTTMKCYMEYGKVEDDFDTLRVLIELLEGRPTSQKVKMDFLKGKVIEWISRNNRLFLRTITDELLPGKVLIKKCVEAGLIGKKNDTYYLRESGQPLCEMNEESTLNNAARFLLSVKRQELKYSLEAKVKD
jgi:hypothetical protein